MNEIEKNKTFEQKMSLKIQEVIGDMISADELVPLVEQGIKKAFFEERKYYTGGGYSKIEEPLMLALVTKYAKSTVEELVKKWLEDNPDNIKEIFDNVVRDGLGTLVFESLNNKFQNNLFDLSNKIQEQIGQGRF